uniref:Phosphomannomutase n=1 Tax=Spongospora subterranea TaxID=70186 RepID=A0A0H5R6F1_9EUKA|eukprot:CRZ09327.1 hypothetical protein [Spongospora subterranea]
MSRARKIMLFDVDGTLTKPRLKADAAMIEFLQKLKKHTVIGFVGGSDLSKIKEQLGDDCVNLFDYGFSENGLVAFRNASPIGEMSILQLMGETRLQAFTKFCLRYLADLEIPKQRGTFIEFRTGMINICPIGRNCSQAERDEFEQYDKKHQIRATMIEALKRQFPEEVLTYSIGGQISFDVFPTGWDKTYCLSFLEEEGFAEVHFFGDKTHQGGNDYEIFEDARTVGHTVANPDDTMAQVMEVLGVTAL